MTDAKLNVDSLDVLADPGMIYRFDRFNAKFNPFGSAQLRLMFLKYDNEMRGKYFAELLQQKVLNRFKRLGQDLQMDEAVRRSAGSLLSGQLSAQNSV